MVAIVIQNVAPLFMSVTLLWLQHLGGKDFLVTIQ